MRATFLGILGERFYTMDRDSFSAIRTSVLTQVDSGVFTHVVSDPNQHVVVPFRNGVRQMSAFSIQRFKPFTMDFDDDDLDDDDDTLNQEFEAKYINIIRLTGPMTRGGGECSFGSIDHRDMLMRAADHKDVIGHIIYCRTPGGMASTLNDYRKAIEYIHSKGQSIYMFCDGDVFSGGAFLSAMCDGVYAFNPNDRIGSIGMYSAFFALPDGSVNSITQERYVEYFASKSTDKCLEQRNAAVGDYEELKKNTDAYLDELLAMLRQDRPSITEDQMTGKTYKMSEAEGTMIDGFCSLMELCDKIHQDWVSAHPVRSSSGNEDNNQNHTIMEKEYKQIADALGYEGPMVGDKDGQLTLQAEEADRLSEILAKRSDNTDAMRQSLREKDSAIADLSKQLEDERKANEENMAKMAELNDRVTKLSGELSAEKESTESLRIQNADLVKEVAELKQSCEQKPLGSVGSNAEQPAVKRMLDGPVYDPYKSFAENNKAFEDYMKGLRSRN